MSFQIYKIGLFVSSEFKKNAQKGGINLADQKIRIVSNKGISDLRIGDISKVIKPEAINALVRALPDDLQNLVYMEIAKVSPDIIEEDSIVRVPEYPNDLLVIFNENAFQPNAGKYLEEILRARVLSNGGKLPSGSTMFNTRSSFLPDNNNIKYLLL